MRSLIIFIALGVIASCGGGGGSGGSIAIAPPQPSVTVSGNRGTYRQDEPIVIDFSASNLDQNTISWSISNYDEESFKLDSVNGVFRNVETDFETSKSWLTLPARNFSLTVTATDGAGKSASRAFQFSIDAVPTGFFIASEPNPQGTAIRTVGIDFTRDGLAYFEAYAYRATVSDVERGALLRTQKLVCYGESTIDGALVEGSASCGGELASLLDSTGYYWNDDIQQEDEILVATEFNPIDAIEFSFSSGEDHDYTGTLNFYDASGGLVETWNNIHLANQLNSDGFSSSNERLVGRYLAFGAAAQYKTTVVPYPDGRFFREISPGSLVLDIKSDFSITSLDFQPCQIQGAIGTSSLDELESISGSLGDYFRNNRTRNLAATYSSLDCTPTLSFPPELVTANGLHPEEPIDLSQSDGSALISVFEARGFLIGEDSNQGDVIVITVAGPGNEGPFRFDLVKICDDEGTPTGYFGTPNYDPSVLCESNEP